MMKNFKFFALLLSIFAIVVLAGCNSSDDRTDYLDQHESYSATEPNLDISDISEEMIAFEADNARLADWIGDVILQFEEIDVERPLMFIATTGGFITGIRSTLPELNASDYVKSQVEIVTEFIENVQDIVVENLDNEDLDLVEVRDIILETLVSMQEIFAQN